MLASYRFLSTTVEPFKPKYLSEVVLRRLMKQRVYFQCKINQDDVLPNAQLSPSEKKEEDEAHGVLYKYGVSADYFVMILEGRVRVLVGKERLMYEAGPFTTFGVSTLKVPMLNYDDIDDFAISMNKQNHKPPQNRMSDPDGRIQISLITPF